MARNAHPDAMKPARPGRTRTAPPQMPDQFPAQGRYLPYVLFDATGVLYLLVSLVAIRLVWALGSGQSAYDIVMAQLANPLYVGFHLLTLVAVVFVGVRFFGLFPKSQPPRIGPLKPPPEPVILAGLYVAWIAVAGGLAFILAGGIVR